jgi:hypothetical protein
LTKSEIDLLPVARTREVLAVVVPVHFLSSVPEPQIRDILSSVFGEADLFCRRKHLLAVVDRGTTAEKVLQEFPGLRIHSLQKNRGKAGAIGSGLAELLETSDARYFATRDCDGDHAQEDLSRLVSLAAYVERVTGSSRVAVMGARPSLEKPMGWVRDQWERLTNAVLVDLLQYALARGGRVTDRRFWGGSEPDIQSGYRVYSREAAEQTRDVLTGLPEERDILTFACEFVPFADLVAAGGVTAQAQRFTLIEQPVSNYGGVDFGRVYGRLLAYVADRHDVPRPIVRQIFDNRLVGMSLFFTGAREELFKARRLVDANAPRLSSAPFL